MVADSLEVTAMGRLNFSEESAQAEQTDEAERPVSGRYARLVLDKMTNEAVRMTRRNNPAAGNMWDEVFALCPTSLERDAVLERKLVERDREGREIVRSAISDIIAKSQHLPSIAAMHRAMSVGFYGRDELFCSGPLLCHFGVETVIYANNDMNWPAHVERKTTEGGRTTSMRFYPPGLFFKN